VICYVTMSSSLLLSTICLFHFSGDHRDLHSFPTRRSSDLGKPVRGIGERRRGQIGPKICAVEARQAEEQVGMGLYSANLWTNLRSEEHTSELQSPCNLVCRLLLEKKKKQIKEFT